MRDTFRASTAWERSVADYCGCSLMDVQGLRVVDYLALRRDAFIHACEQTEEGREYLENAKRITATDMDSAALREQFGARTK